MHNCTPYTIYILDASEQVLWQTVKILMKFCIMWHFISFCSCLFARQKQSSGTEMHHFIENLTSYPLKYEMDIPYIRPLVKSAY